MKHVNSFEQMIVDDDIILLKVYFSISKNTQQKRFNEIKASSLKKWKFTEVDGKAQKLWDKYKNKGLLVIGVPSNSFNQEKNEDSEVKKFCEVNFNINFPLTTITDVKGKNAHEIFKWAKENHGNSAIPKWNFYKILINKEGKIEDTFASMTKPMSKKILFKIEKIL